MLHDLRRFGTHVYLLHYELQPLDRKFVRTAGHDTPAGHPSADQMSGACKSLARRWLFSQRGTTAVEFALILPTAIFLCLGILELGRGLLLRGELSHAIDLGARRILLDNAVADQTIIDAVKAGIKLTDATKVDVTTQSLNDDNGAFRMIEARTQHQFILPFIALDTVVIGVKRRIPIISS